MRFLLISLIILLIGLLGIFNPIRDAVQYAFSPVQYGLQTTAQEIKNTINFFTNIRDIREENLSLIRENQALKSKISELRIYEDENIALSMQLELKNSAEFEKDLLLANVLGDPTDPTGSRVFIDKGRRHGVSMKDNVVLGKNLLGIVTNVGFSRSEVTLINSPSSAITVVNVDTSFKTEGLLVGKFGTSMEMTRILPVEEISIGDTILSSGKDGKYDPALVVGTVVEVIEESAEPLKSAIVESNVDLKNLDKVFVILNK